jgi:hypothetical protein
MYITLIKITFNIDIAVKRLKSYWQSMWYMECIGKMVEIKVKAKAKNTEYIIQINCVTFITAFIAEVCLQKEQLPRCHAQVS